MQTDLAPASDRQDRSPRQNPRDKRPMICALAAGMFAERGVLGVSGRMIARASRTPVATINDHFGKREDLLAGIIAEHLFRLNQRVCSACDATAGAAPESRLLAMLLALLDSIAAEPSRHFLAMHAIGGLGDRERKPAETRLRVMLEAFAEPLQEVNPSLTTLQAVMLAGSVVGGVGDALAWAESDSATDHAGLAMRLVAALVAGAGTPGVATGVLTPAASLRQA